MSDDLICSGCGEYAGSPIADRIKALEAALMKADDLEAECKRMAPAIWDAFNNRSAGARYGIATANAFDHRLAAYRAAREATI